MPKVTGFNRKRIGHRNHFATIDTPPATKDAYGQISYGSGTWTTTIADWPCELIDVAGGEIIDGFMTKSTTEKVAIGDMPAAVNDVTTKSRVTINSKVYGVTAVRDVSGDGRTLRIELKSAGT